MSGKIVKTDEQWKEELTPQQFEICRAKGTELPFSGDYTNVFKSGSYACVCCGNTLFSSDSKFQSGCGWPSFSAPFDKAAMINKVDAGLGMKRIEVLCSRCDAHLGHVFDDGPQPDGLRYCINSVALDFTAD